MKKRMKFVPLDLKGIDEMRCYVCKKKNKYCKCIGCKFCGEFTKRNQECRNCKKRNIVKKFAITNAELNALEDLGLTDLKTMFKEKRDKEVEIWQDRCRAAWHKLVRKIDRVGS